MFRIALLSLALSACHDSPPVVNDAHNTLVMKAIPNRDLDILFVVDDSASMFDKQGDLAEAFPEMIDLLSQLDGGLPNLHIGVITPNMGTSSQNSDPAASIYNCNGVGMDGALQLGTVATTDGMPFLVDVDAGNGTRQRNYTGALRDAFASAASVGAEGCGFEQPLAATARALENPVNAGFLRPEANLAIVYLVDEDDCSAGDASLFAPASQENGLSDFRCFRHGVTCDEDLLVTGPKTNCVPAPDGVVAGVESFVDRVIAAKSDERKVMVAVIGGPSDPIYVEPQASPDPLSPAQASVGLTCTYLSHIGPSVAKPSLRLQAFADAFTGRSTFASVCAPDLTPALDQIGESAKGLMGSACLDSAQLADSDPAAPGIQPTCEVVDIADSAPSTERALVPCSADSADCYEIVADAAACPATSDNLRVRMRRTSAVTDDTWTYVRCKRTE